MINEIMCIIALIGHNKHFRNFLVKLTWLYSGHTATAYLAYILVYAYETDIKYS